MAKAKLTPEDVEMERVRASTRRSEKICDTIFWCFLIVGVTVCVGLIAWAAVRISDKPAWLTVVLALVGFCSPSLLVAWGVAVRLRKQVAERLPEPQSPESDADDAPDAPGGIPQ